MNEEFNITYLQRGTAESFKVETTGILSAIEIYEKETMHPTRNIIKIERGSSGLL